jgi:hypothetical protein
MPPWPMPISLRRYPVLGDLIIKLKFDGLLIKKAK